MPINDNEQYLRELEAKIQILEAENERLIEHNEEILLLGLVAESISAQEQPGSILAYTLERISLLKNVAYCAFCELLDDEAYILTSYSTFRENHSSDDQIILSPSLIAALMDGAQVLSEADLDAQRITFKLEGCSRNPRGVLLIPFKSRLIQRGILLLWDIDYSPDQLSQQITPLTRVLEIIISRLDNLSFVQELQHLNVALNLEVDRRVGELHETNEQLRETTLLRLQVEDALLRQHDIVSNISETSPFGIAIMNKQGQITYANDRGREILGLTRNQIIGNPYHAPEWTITDFEGNPYPQDELPFFKVMTTGQPAKNLQYAIERPDGKRVLLAVNAAPLYDDDFNLNGVIAVIEDVSEQVAAEAEFRRLQNFNASIVQNISEGIVVQNQAGEFTFVNPAAANILGYGPEEINGRHWKDLISPDQHAIVEAADERRQQGKADRYELELQHKDGQYIQVRVSGSPKFDVRTGEFLGSLAVFSDISEQKYAESIRKAQRELALQLSAVTGVDNLLRLCLNAAVQNTSMEVGGIYFVDQHTRNVHLEHSLGLSPEFLEDGAYYKADSDNARLIAKGEPVYLNNADLKMVMTPAQIREELLTVAILPIHHDGKVIASLNMASRTSHEIPETTKNMLETIAAQIGSAVSRAQAEDKLAQRAEQLKLINDIGEKIAAVLELESVLTRTAQLIRGSFGYQHVALFLVDPQKEIVALKTIASEYQHIFSPDHHLALGQGLVGTAALKNLTQLANNVEIDPTYVNLYPDKLQIRAELSVPIHIGGEVLGVIDAQSKQPNAFDESDVIVMETLADQVAIAIHNANLHESVQRELTERTRIETALRESEEKFRNIVESSPMGMHMYQLEPDGRLIFVGANPSADTMLGVKNSQFIGKTIEEAFPGLSKTEIPEKYRQVATQGITWKEDQIVYEENEISGAFEVYAFQTSPGRVAVLFLEVTERKRAEEALRHSENTLSSLFRAAPTGIGLVSERMLLQVNQRICEMTGYSQDELVGQNARILYPSDEDYEYVGREKYRQISDFGTGTVETRWQHKNGHIVDVLMSSTPIDLDDLTIGVTFTALDITERKKAEARSQRQLRRLASLSQIDAAITSNLSLDRTIEILLEQSIRQLDIDAATILLYKPATQTLDFFAAQGFITETIKTTKIRLGQDFAGRAALERRTIKATDAEINFLTNDAFALEGFRSYYGVPLIAKGQIKGVLEVFHRKPLTPSEGWLSFLETVAGQAAIAIDSAELVENLERSNLELRLAYNTTLEGWAKALELRDFETQGHSHRVTELTIQLASEVGIPNHQLVHVQRGALLHDIGKMGISDSILLKPGPLDDAEWEIMRQHPVYAYEMLSPIKFLRPAIDIPHYHHEKWDGSGYPHGLKGEAIPLAARVFAIIDVWDALSSDRPYRSAWPETKIFEHIRSQIGKHFDPRVAAAFFSIIQSE